jgi:signal transduction histidine kinase
MRGKLQLKGCPVDLAAVIWVVIEDMRLMAEAKAIQVDAVLDPSVKPVLGDPDRLQQIVWNLLSNALKFTPVGGRVTVKLSRVRSQSQRTRDKYAQIQVSDTGIGISPEFLPHVFEHFRQADSALTREHGGLGLGLAIVLHLVELHRGTVRVTSEGKAKGTTVTVQLPLHKES